MKSIYLDYNATTPVDKRVLETMLPYFSEKYGNPASKTHSLGWTADEAVSKARRQLAELIHAEEGEIVFTSGATEAINLAIKGVWETYQHKGNHIITVATEHKAVLDTCKWLEKRGARVSYLPVDREGGIDLQMLEGTLCKETILICIMLANNETGVIQPMESIAGLAHEHGVILMSDATQAVGKIPVDVQNPAIDLLCLSAHKFYGPKGAGALYVRRKNPRVALTPLLHGGGHEKGLRPGTLNTPAIVGLGAACELAEKELWDDGIRISKLRTRLEQALTETGQVFVNGSIKNRLPNTTNLWLTAVKADSLIRQLPELAMAMGSACTSTLPEPSHVLKAMGLTDVQTNESIRLSLGKYTTEEEINMTIHLLKEILLSATA